MLRCRDNMRIPKLGNNIKLKMMNKTVIIEGKLDNNEDTFLFSYYGEFKPISAKNILNKQSVHLIPSGLGFWNKGSDKVKWDDDTSLWGDKDNTYIHMKKLTRKLK